MTHDRIARLLECDGDNIKANVLGRSFQVPEVSSANAPQCFFLFSRHAIKSGDEAAFSTCFDLYKNDNVLITAYQIDLITPIAPVGTQKRVSFLAQPFCGETLAITPRYLCRRRVRNTTQP